MYGVIRATTFEKVEIPLSCVVEAVRSVPGVNDVSVQSEEGPKPVTLHGIERPDVIQRVSYRYDGLSGNFYFQTNYEGRVRFSQSYLSMNMPPPQEHIDKIRPAFEKIEAAIAKQCPSLQALERIQEECLPVKCIK